MSASDGQLHRQRAVRESLFIKAELITASGIFPAQISNLSLTGAFIRTTARLEPEHVVRVTFWNNDAAEALVRRVTTKGYGIQFTTSINTERRRSDQQSAPEKTPGDFLLHLRENGRRPIWDTSGTCFRRPAVR
jgi:hypothetical protein